MDANGLNQGLLGGGPVVPRRRPGQWVSAVAASALLFGVGVFFMMPNVPDVSRKIASSKPLKLKEVLGKYPRPDNMHELNAFFAQLPAHDDEAKVFKHVSPHAEAVYRSYLEHFGTTAPHWKTQAKERRHQLDDVSEFTYRLGIFTEMMRTIIKQNAFEAANNRNPDRAIFGLTKFADWTWEEFKTMFTHAESPRNTTSPKKVTRLSGPKMGETPCNKNWAAENRELFTPRQQGQCGSCYAHAAAEELRAMAFINAGFDPGPLSVQYIVDCSGHGCSGGDASNIMDWVHQQGGIPAKVDYGPYSASRQMCKKGIPFAVTTSGAERHQDEADTARTICNEGPTSMGVLANGAFMSYRRGVLSHQACPSGMNNHDTQAVAVVASKGAWLIRNSWGKDWGVDPVNFEPGTDAGFILLEYGYDTCGVTQLNGIPKNVVKATGCTGGSCDVPAPAPVGPGPAPAPGGSLCTNECIFSNDGACDDGGSGSAFEVCGYGTDCSDCGPREPSNTCEDTCMWARDGACDEGSGGAPGLCRLGTDCTDCGGNGNNPCAHCRSGHLGAGESCLLASDGTCSTPNNAYYCFDSHDRLRVSSC